MNPIKARAIEMERWVESQEERIAVAWSSISEDYQKRIRAKYLSSGEHAPADLPMRVVDRILMPLARMRLDPEPKVTTQFLSAMLMIRTPKDPVALELGSDTYLPEVCRILGQGRRNVRITG